MIKLSDYLIDYIARMGVTHIFMLPGGGCMHIVDSIGRNNNINFVGCLHEQAAVIAADGYAQYKNDIGVALVTTGPGGTNAITGVAASWIDSTPLLIISGQVKRSDLLREKGVRQMGVQEVDIVSIVKPITKYAVTVMEPKSIRYHLEKAIYMAKSGRPGPCWLDIPLDVQATMIDENALEGFTPDLKSNTVNKDLETDVIKVIELLNNSEQPVILAGRGLKMAGVEKEFLNIIETLKIPVLTTWRAADIVPEDNEYFFGRPGTVSSRYANFIIQQSDFLLTLGARLDLPQVGFNYENFAPRAKKVVVDIDEAEIKKTGMNIDVPIVSDLKEFIFRLKSKLALLRQKDRTPWIQRCREWKSRYPVLAEFEFNENDSVNPYFMIDMLSDLLTEDDLIVPGSSGSCAEITPQIFRVKNGQRIINSPGLGSMGFGLPQSIGVYLASGGKRVVCIEGDGSLQHNIQELETLKRLNLPIKLFVLNNNGYASIRNTHRRFFEGRLVCCDPSSGLTLPKTIEVAKAYGLNTFMIEKNKELREKMVEVLEINGPVICEVLADPDLQLKPRVSSKALPDGRMISMPLENMWPFLPDINTAY